MEKIEAEFINITSDENASRENVVDIEGKYEAYFKENEVEAIVVRPDFNIFAGVSNVQDLPDVIDSLKSSLQQKAGTVSAV